MFKQILYLFTILSRKTISRGIRNVYNRSSSFNYGFNHTCKIFIVRTPCILGVKLNILDIFFCIPYSCNRAFYDFITITVKLIFYM